MITHTIIRYYYMLRSRIDTLYTNEWGNGPLQKQRWVFCNQNHCLLCVCLHSSQQCYVEVYERMYIRIHIQTPVRMSVVLDRCRFSVARKSTTGKAHTRLHTSISPTTKNNSRVRARLRHCQLSRATVHRAVYRVNRHTIDCYKIAERKFQRISLMRVWRFECKT